MCKERIILDDLNKELSNLDNGQLNNLNFIASGNMTRGAKNTRDRLINKKCNLIEKIRVQKLKVKIVESESFLLEDIHNIIFWHCRKAEHIKIREVSMYEYCDMSKFPIGNLYDVIFKAEKNLQRLLSKHGLRYGNQHVKKDKEGRYKVENIQLVA